MVVYPVVAPPTHTYGVVGVEDRPSACACERLVDVASPMVVTDDTPRVCSKQVFAERRPLAEKLLTFLADTVEWCSFHRERRAAGPRWVEEEAGPGRPALTHTLVSAQSSQGAVIGRS
jgi:hypothetical protein